MLRTTVSLCVACVLLFGNAWAQAQPPLSEKDAKDALALIKEANLGKVTKLPKGKPVGGRTTESHKTTTGRVLDLDAQTSNGNVTISMETELYREPMSRNPRCSFSTFFVNMMVSWWKRTRSPYT